MNTQRHGAVTNNLAADRAVEDSNIARSFQFSLVKMFQSFKYICELFLESTNFLVLGKIFTLNVVTLVRSCVVINIMLTGSPK